MTEVWQIALVGAAAALIGGICGGVLPPLWEACRDSFYKPVLAIDHAVGAAYRTEANYKTKDGVSVAEVFIRVRVINKGRSPAKGVRVFLTSIEEVFTGATNPTSFHDSRALSWPPWDFEPRDIPPARGVHTYVDVVKVSKHHSGWIFCVDKSYGMDGLTGYSGTYRLTLTATADNAKPTFCKIDVTYDGNWNNLRAVAVSPG